MSPGFAAGRFFTTKTIFAVSLFALPVAASAKTITLYGN